MVSHLPFQAYDQHLNMILGDVEETVTTIEIDEETYEEIYKVSLVTVQVFVVVSASHTCVWRGCPFLTPADGLG